MIDIEKLRTLLSLDIVDSDKRESSMALAVSCIPELLDELQAAREMVALQGEAGQEMLDQKNAEIYEARTIIARQAEELEPLRAWYDAPPSEAYNAWKAVEEWRAKRKSMTNSCERK